MDRIDKIYRIRKSSFGCFQLVNPVNPVRFMKSKENFLWISYLCRFYWAPIEKSEIAYTRPDG